MSQYLSVVQNYSPVWNWFVCVSIFYTKVVYPSWMYYSRSWQIQIVIEIRFFSEKHYSFGFISPNVWAASANMIRMRIPAKKGETDTGKGEVTGLFDLICDMTVDKYWRRKQTVCVVGISFVFSVSSGVFHSFRLGNPLCSPLMWSPSLGTRSRALTSAERGLEFLGMPRGLCTWVDLGFAARDFLQ